MWYVEAERYEDARRGEELITILHYGGGANGSNCVPLYLTLAHLHFMHELNLGFNNYQTIYQQCEVD